MVLVFLRRFASARGGAQEEANPGHNRRAQTHRDHPHNTHTHTLDCEARGKRGEEEGGSEQKRDYNGSLTTLDYLISIHTQTRDWEYTRSTSENAFDPSLEIDRGFVTLLGETSSY